MCVTAQYAGASREGLWDARVVFALWMDAVRDSGCCGQEDPLGWALWSQLAGGAVLHAFRGPLQPCARFLPASPPPRPVSALILSVPVLFEAGFSRVGCQTRCGLKQKLLTRYSVRGDERSLQEPWEQQSDAARSSFPAGRSGSSLEQRGGSV